jgi:hypothetical protein
MTIGKIQEIQENLTNYTNSLTDKIAYGTTLGLLYTAMALFEVALSIKERNAIESKRFSP